MPGPAPKPESQRRRRNKPKSLGAAEPITAPAAVSAGRDLGFENPHPLVASMWEAVARSCECTFYAEADWERLRMELWYANTAMVGGKPISGHTWGAIQHGLNELLLSPAIKRRAGIELRPQAVDADADAAVAMTGKYRQMLKSV
jgi:hypothetical protein